MPAIVPARDLSEAPVDWLQARFVMLDESEASEDKFVRRIEAICRLRDIEEREEREERHWYGGFEEVKAELIRRGLREPDPPPEFMPHSEVIAAIREKLGCKTYEARCRASLLPIWTEDGREWSFHKDRKWYRITDVEALLRDG